MKQSFNKLPYLAACALLFFALTSCSDKEDEFFDASSAQNHQETVHANNPTGGFALEEENLGLYTGTVLVSFIDSKTGVWTEILYDNTTATGRKLLEASGESSESSYQATKEKEEDPLVKRYITDDYYMYSHWQEREVKNGRVVITTYDKESGKYTGISYDAEYYKKLFGE